MDMQKRRIPLIAVLAFLLALLLEGCDSEPSGTQKSAAPVPAPDFTASTEQDIVAVVSSRAELSTFVSALKATDLVSALQEPGSLTVFAPTNDAFSQLPPGRLADLLKPTNKATLKAILTYHIAAEAHQAEDIAVLDWVATLNGSDIKITKTDNGLMTDTAMIIAADIRCRNGIIHLIDTVLLPE